MSIILFNNGTYNIEDLYKSIYSLQCEGIECDLTLISEDGESFPVHGAVIASSIPRIREMICAPHGYLFYMSSIRLTGVKGRELRLAIQYAYLNQCEMPQEATEVLEIIMASLYLGIEALYNMGIQVLHQSLDMNTVAQILQPTLFPVTTMIYDLAEHHALRHLLYTTDCSFFNEDKMIELLNNEKLYAPHEEDAIIKAIRWVEKAPASRISHFYRLLRALRLGLLAPGSFELLKRHPFVEYNEEAKFIMESVNDTMKRYQCGITGVLPVDWCRVPICLRPRLPHLMILFTGGWTETVCDTVTVYDHHAERWKEIPGLALPEPRVYHSIEIIDSQIYLLGGFDGSRNMHLDTCYSINLHDEIPRWESISKMNYVRSFLSSTVLEGQIYVVGGRHSNLGRHVSVESFDTSLNQWTNLPSLSSPVSDAGLVTLYGKLYVGGGYDGNRPRSELTVFDPETDSWRQGPSLGHARLGLKLVALQGVIYAIGGFDGNVRCSMVERYEPKGSTMLSTEWTQVSPMLLARSNFAVAVLHGRILVMGGFTEDGITSACEMYDPGENKWYPMEPLIKPCSGGCCCIVDDITVTSKFLTRGESRSRSWRPSQHRPRSLSFAAVMTPLPDDD